MDTPFITIAGYECGLPPLVNFGYVEFDEKGIGHAVAVLVKRRLLRQASIDHPALDAVVWH